MVVVPHIRSLLRDGKGMCNARKIPSRPVLARCKVSKTVLSVFLTRMEGNTFAIAGQATIQRAGHLEIPEKNSTRRVRVCVMLLCFSRYSALDYDRNVKNSSQHGVMSSSRMAHDAQAFAFLDQAPDRMPPFLRRGLFKPVLRPVSWSYGSGSGACGVAPSVPMACKAVW